MVVLHRGREEGERNRATPVSCPKGLLPERTRALYRSAALQQEKMSY